MESGTHYVYVVTTLGYVYKLSDSGTAFAIVAGWPYQNGASATATSPLGIDTSNIYWAGNDGAGAKKMFSLSFSKTLNGTRTAVADIVAAPRWPAYQEPCTCSLRRTEKFTVRPPICRPS